MRRLLCFIPLICLVAALAHCGSSSDSNQVGGAPTGTNADSQAAQQSMSAADDASSTDAVGASQTPSAMLALELTERLADASATATFMVGDCTGQVAYTADVSGTTVTITATDIFSNDSCKGKLKLSGSQNIVITADASNSQRTALVSGTLTRTLDGGDEVTVATLDPTLGYAYKLVAIGTRASGDVNVMVSINEHRVRTSGGSTIFDHNIVTPATAGVLVVAAYDSDGSPKSRTIDGGEIDVHHNLAKFTAKHTYNSLFHDLTGDCACPSNGSITQVVTGDANDWTYTRTYAFTDCGKATVITSGSTQSRTSNGTATVQWENCTN